MDAALAPPQPSRWPAPRQWAVFVLQLFLITLVDASNDIFRGNIMPPNAGEAIRHARDVATFEAAHGLFVEPAWQLFFEHTRHLFGLAITWPAVVDLADDVYEYCHVFVTLAVLTWVFVVHRHRFPRIRNLLLFTNTVAAIAYEIYPLAPPRLTPGVIFAGHPFHFQDTMRQVIGTGKLTSVPLGYNPFSAMPSLHVAWALVVALSILFLARHPLVRMLGLFYPAVMVVTVVVTGNHYLLDAIGATGAVTVAALLTLGIERLRSVRWDWRHKLPLGFI